MPRERKGSIRERRGGVFARVTFTDDTGNRREIERKAENRTHAKQLIKDVIRQLDDGVDILGSNSLTLDKYLDQWLEIVKSKLSNKTYSDYQQLFRLYVRPVIGKKALSNIKPLNIQSLYKGMQEKGLSPKTIRYVHTTLSVALKQAVRWRMIIQNPCTAVELPKLQRKEMQSLSPEDATRFIEAARQDRHGLIFILALTTGMRPEEYLGLQWKDIDFNRHSVTVQRVLCWHRNGGGYYLDEPKTAKSRRAIPIPVSLIHDLIEHKRKQSEQRLKAGSKWKDQDLVFATSEGKPLQPNNLIKRHFKPVLRKAGLSESIRLYDLRHSCATLLLSEGENAKIVSERLGHSSIVLTLDTYSHVLPSMQRGASDKLEKLLFGSKSNTNN